MIILCSPAVRCNKFSYDESGNCNGEVLRPPAAATKLRWEIPDECANIMKRSLYVAREAIQDLDLWIEVMHNGDFQKIKISPSVSALVETSCKMEIRIGKSRATSGV